MISTYKRNTHLVVELVSSVLLAHIAQYSLQRYLGMIPDMLYFHNVIPPYLKSIPPNIVNQNMK